MIGHGNAKRIFAHPYWGGSTVSFEDWDGLNEHETLCIKTFEEGIENTITQFPPEMDVHSEADDVVLTFVLHHLGGADDGPVWQFSLKEALTGLCWDDELKVKLLIALLSVAEHLKQQTKES